MSRLVEHATEGIEKDTVSIYFVNAAIARLSEPARERVLQKAGIPGRWLGAPHARVPAPAFSALWLAVASELDDEFFGLDRRAMKVGSFALVCQAAMGCPTLDRALRRMLRGFTLFLDDVRAELHLADGCAQVRLHNRITDPAARRFADETMLVLIHGLLCWLATRRLVLHRVSFAQSRPEHADEYTRMFSEHVDFDAAYTAIEFDAQALASPIVQTTDSLQAFLRTAPQSVFLKYKNEDSWTARLRRRLRGCLREQSWPVFEALAAEFAITPTTLRRRLDAEGCTYSGLKDQLRRDWAIAQLGDSTLSLDDMASQLGFHDASTFHRAFKRWTGLQPGEYRRRRSLAEPTA
jgi:AraC-like DNA-binding protein